MAFSFQKDVPETCGYKKGCSCQHRLGFGREILSSAPLLVLLEDSFLALTFNVNTV
jgi:hypothetical protein